MGEDQGDQPTQLPEQATTQGSETPTPVSVNTTENRLDQSPRPAQSHIARAATLPARRSLDTSKSKHIPGKVRFSSDIERVSPANYDAPTRQGLDAQRPPTATGLRINTDVESFPSVVSPNNGRVVSSGSAITNAPLSPPSPQSRTRDRGYSLRRTLFAKNIQTQSATETIRPSIELQTQRPSTAKTSVTQEKVSVVAEEEIRPVATLETDSQDEDGISLSYSESTPLKHTLSLTAGQNWLKATACKWKAYEYLDQWNEAIKEKVFRIKPLPPTKDGRHIELNVSAVDELVDERSDSSYVDNSIRSSRYSLWSFFPKQLIAQFSKVANFYFLVVSILQMIPGLSTTGTFTTIIPLLIFVGISMGKEGFDDLRRYRLDKEENNRYVHVLQPDGRRSQETKKSRSKDATPVLEDDGHWVAVKWRDVRVGDVIQLHRNQPVPADVVLLHAEGQNGVAHIETMALDGETNLKMKQPCQSVAKACKTPQDIIERRNLIRFTVEDPNIDLYKFDGNVTVNDEKLPITNTEILYRGSILRNTARIYAMVIYTGEECKIRMNANKNPRIKKPALQTVVNYVVVLIVAMVLLLAMICTIAYSVWDENYQEKAWYLTNATVAIGPVFTSYLIMFNTMIPISLYVSMEIVKVGQMLLLNDIDMYDEESDTPLEARTSTINEELGQVSYIFSDKTGTLTNNTMKFRMMSVAGTAWLHDSDLREEAARDADKHWLIHKKRSVKGKKAMSRKSGVESIHGASSIRMSMASAHDQPSRARSIAHGKPFRGGNTMQMLEYIQRKPHTLFARKAKFFILSLALCHTCIPEQDEAGNITYQAASPDEMALVTAAQQLGYLVMDRQQNTLTVRTYPSGHDDDPWDEVYEVLDVIEFTSARKRMSVIVRMPDQRICLFCKGADSIVTKLLRQASLAQQKAVQIERRASQRKAEEAFEVMRRNSEHQSPINVRNPSLSRRRSSGLTGKRDSLRRSVDIWLKDRETDGGMLNRDNGDEYYSPRPSTQFNRNSMASSDGRPSFQEDDDGYLVEESLVVDDHAVFERCFQHLNDFATEGLRTLMYASRFLDEASYTEWKQAYQEASTSLVDRQAKIEKVGEQIEMQLELVGATAIEDKLQKGVPEAIDKLRRANIKLWMLTGDKRETAINIGHSCRLVKEYSELIILDHEAGDVERTIVSTINSIRKGRMAHSVLVIDGQTLSIIEGDAILMPRFFKLAIMVDSVICCRASPKQKAFLVKSVRKHVLNAITLAIGDGANDIAMIQEAHVGIGITGKEGLQAARISDYSIAQFRFLLKLLLVHGRWNYNRICKYTLGTFWKEMLFYLTQALFQHYNGYTGTSLYENWSLSMFNTLFTSLAVIFLGVLEKDLSASTLLAVPELYTKGQRNQGFNIRIYLGWALMAVIEAVIVFYTMYGLFGQSLMGIDNTIFPMGLLTFTACVTIINLKLQFLEIHYKTIVSAIVLIVSIGGWFLWNIILSTRYDDATSGKSIYDVHGNFLTRIGRSLNFWAVLFLIIASVLLFETTVTLFRQYFFPTDVDIFQHLERDPAIKRRFEEAAASELQQGWDRSSDKVKSSLEIARDEEEQLAREREVNEYLNRPRTTTDLNHPPLASRGAEIDEEAAIVDVVARSGSVASTSNNPRRKSHDIHDLFSKGFGSIKRGHL